MYRKLLTKSRGKVEIYKRWKQSCMTKSDHWDSEYVGAGMKLGKPKPKWSWIWGGVWRAARKRACTGISATKGKRGKIWGWMEWRMNGVHNLVTKDAEQALGVSLPWFLLVSVAFRNPRSNWPEGKPGSRKTYPLWVRLKGLDRPDVYKFIVPDEVYPRVLQELADVIKRIFNCTWKVLATGHGSWMLTDWWGMGVDFPSMLILWTGAWAASFSWPCFEQLIGVDDLIPILAFL